LLIVIAALAALLLIPAGAAAKRLATAAQKHAMAYQTRNGTSYKIPDPNFPATEHIPSRCLVAYVSTAKVPGASRWGYWTWSNYGAHHLRRCKTANGVTAVHFTAGHWYVKGGGSSFRSVPGMPKAVFNDLFRSP
jgi:hypothetical protein